MASPSPPRRRRNTVLRKLRSGGRERFILDLLRSWNKLRILRIAAIILGAWLIGAVGTWLAERKINPAFSTLGESLWSVWVLLFSGVEVQPQTTMGRLFAMILVVAGIGLVGLFTGTVASILVEAHLRSRDVENFEMEGHLVICNWAPRALQLVREVHSKMIQQKRPVVIIHDDPEQIVLPDQADDPAFNDVYIVRGDPSNEVILRRARASRAHSVVVLADDREGKHADGKSIITCIALRNIARGDTTPSVVVECQNPGLVPHLRKAGADEIISSDELGLRLMARTALFHGMTQVYQELLTVGRDANEMYLLPAPEALFGRDFVELSNLFARHRDNKQSCLLIGIHRGEQMHLNPIGGEAGPLKAGDQLILLSRVFLDPGQQLPIDLPTVAAPAAEGA